MAFEAPRGRFLLPKGGIFSPTRQFFHSDCDNISLFQEFEQFLLRNLKADFDYLF